MSLGATCQIQGYTLHLVTLVYLSFWLAPFGHYTSEQLTKLYSGELPACAALSQLANIARLPSSNINTLSESAGGTGF